MRRRRLILILNEVLQNKQKSPSSQGNTFAPFFVCSFFFIFIRLFFPDFFSSITMSGKTLSEYYATVLNNGETLEEYLYRKVNEKEKLPITSLASVKEVMNELIGLGFSLKQLFSATKISDHHGKRIVDATEPCKTDDQRNNYIRLLLFINAPATTSERKTFEVYGNDTLTEIRDLFDSEKGNIEDIEDDLDEYQESKRKVTFNDDQ